MAVCRDLLHISEGYDGARRFGSGTGDVAESGVLHYGQFRQAGRGEREFSFTVYQPHAVLGVGSDVICGLGLEVRGAAFKCGGCGAVA